MPYNSNVIKKVLGDFVNKEKLAVAAAEKRKQELYKKAPELFFIDKELSNTQFRLVSDILSTGGGALEKAEKIEKTKLGNQELQKKRAEILKSHNYPEDYTKPHYECNSCKDSGYIGGDMCICLKKALSEEGLKHSGLGEMTKIQSFENFTLDYYDNPKDSADRSPYHIMKTVLERCVKFAAEFDKTPNKNLFFCGSTGLGKTHLSSAIAREIIEKGYDVVYDTAQRIIYAFEQERFSKSSSGYDENATERYLNCDLLIIDDLGTEYTGSMSVTTLYNIINSRLVADKSMIISTNLAIAKIQSRYDDRIVSRILGEFVVLEFVGSDIRYMKK